MSARLHLVVEGQTEETYVNRVLVPHLADREVWADVRVELLAEPRARRARAGARTTLDEIKALTGLGKL